MRILVIGLGNPILGDDGVGWKVAEEIRRQTPPDLPVDVECFSLGGISLMERMIGYDQVILVDSLAGGGPVGSVLVLPLSDLPNYSAYHTTNSHDTSLQTALEVGRRIGAQLPERVMVVGITALQVFEFGEELSPEVEAAVPQAVGAVLGILSELELAPIPPGGN